MNIIMTSSEIVPYAKTGGLADVVGALPKEISKFKHDIRVVMPLYKAVDRKKYKLEYQGDFQVPLFDQMVETGLYKAKMKGCHVPIYFIENDKYYDREGLYQENGSDYPDNDERFTFFDRAVLEMCKYLNFKPDVIHCNDWQTGLIPVYLKTLYSKDPYFSNTASIFTIHNLAYQGLFDSERVINASHLPWDVYDYDKLEFWNQFSFIKGGLVYADILSTVSDRYSKEIQIPEYGCGLDGLLYSRREDLYGVLNGIDYKLWDPAKDKKIAKNYSVSSLEGKIDNKKELLKRFNLRYRKKAPLIGIVSRLADQKGFDLIAEIIEDILKKNIQIVLLGTGDPKYHDLFANIAQKHPNSFGVELQYDPALAQLIYAGSDMFLMPSKYEPCGLGQLISLKYGTIPIVRETGGLADTIVDFDLAIFEPDKANGFVFSGYDSADLLKRIIRAKNVYADDQKWKKLVKNAMESNFSWKVSAKKYEDLYNTAVGKKNK